MSELKTLQDIEEESVKEYGFDVATLRHLSWTLKQEAIKRVKHHMKFLPDKCIEGRINELTEFANITEEDLKDE